MSLVFISYARADAEHANRLYNELIAAGYDVWLDTERLLAGQKWKVEITNAIRSSSAFIALLSNHSVSHRGYVQHELKEALNVLKTLPANQVYLMPARIEEVSPSEPELEDITWVDLFPDNKYAVGLGKIFKALASISELKPLPPTPSGDSTAATSTAPPFSSMGDAFKILLRLMPQNSEILDGRNELFITFKTNADGVTIPKYLKDTYPESMTIVLQHQYDELAIGENAFSVSLWFSGKKERVTVPYASILSIAEPHIKLLVSASG